jgi:hypothetical protein
LSDAFIPQFAKNAIWAQKIALLNKTPRKSKDAGFYVDLN